MHWTIPYLILAISAISLYIFLLDANNLTLLNTGGDIFGQTVQLCCHGPALIVDSLLLLYPLGNIVMKHSDDEQKHSEQLPCLVSAEMDLFTQTDIKIENRKSHSCHQVISASLEKVTLVVFSLKYQPSLQIFDGSWLFWILPFYPNKITNCDFFYFFDK